MTRQKKTQFILILGGGFLLWYLLKNKNLFPPAPTPAEILRDTLIQNKQKGLPAPNMSASQVLLKKAGYNLTDTQVQALQKGVEATAGRG